MSIKIQIQMKINTNVNLSEKRVRLKSQANRFDQKIILSNYVLIRIEV